MPAAPPPAAVVARLRAAGCVFAEDEAELLVTGAGTPAELEAMVARRVEGLPLEHVLGWAEFHGLRIAVDPGVFVPRRRSEYLVELACSGPHPGGAAGPLVVVDACCGSGALGVAVATRLRAAGAGVELHAADADPGAVRCAARNVAALGGHTHLGDLLDPLPDRLRGRVDVIVANVPYVPSAEVGLMPAEAREHEPRAALDGGPDGLDVLRRLAAAAPAWLAPGGRLLVETGESQAPAALAAVAGSGLAAAVRTSDEHEATVVLGVR